MAGKRFARAAATDQGQVKVVLDTEEEQSPCWVPGALSYTRKERSNAIHGGLYSSRSPWSHQTKPRLCGGPTPLTRNVPWLELFLTAHSTLNPGARHRPSPQPSLRVGLSYFTH